MGTSTRWFDLNSSPCPVPDLALKPRMYVKVVDRLPDERGRGLTLDLSHATAKLSKYQAVITDVPGDARYVTNAMAGK